MHHADHKAAGKMAAEPPASSPPMKFCTADVLACSMIGHVAASTGCLSTGRYQAAMYAWIEHA